MAKKYSSLQSLAKGSDTPYGGSDSTSRTSNPSTFNVPYLKEDSPTFKERDGKSIRNYVPASALTGSSSTTGTSCASKHIVITAGEYVQGSFDIGSNLADSFRDGYKYPSAIYVQKYVGDGQLAKDTNYLGVTGVSDVGGNYVDSSGTTIASSITPTILDGTDTSYIGADTEPFILVYTASVLTPYTQTRSIEVTWSDNTTETFNVLLPGWKNNLGLGESLKQSYTSGNVNGNSVYNCSIGLGDYHDSLVTAKAHSHASVYVNNAANPLFVGYGGASSDHGLINLNVTRIGTKQDNSGLWAEGFQPDDSMYGPSSFATNAHQETWPQGLFYSNPSDESEMLRFSTAYPSTGTNLLSIQDMWNLQYGSSNLSTTNYHPANKVGNVLSADSAQHYEIIQAYLPNTPSNAAGRGWANQFENSEANYSAGNTSGNTNTADDNGAWFAQIETEMASGVGSVWNNSSLGYSTHQGGGANGFLNSPGNIYATPTYQHVQIYSKNLTCNCGSVPGTATPLDLCNEPSSIAYWGYTGVDCNNNPVPTDLWNGTATLGNYGCTNCDYEVSATSCQICACVTGNPGGGGGGGLSLQSTPQVSGAPASTVPVISTTQTPPTTLGGNDAVLNIEVTNGSGGFVYFIEPLGNTSAGLGIGAVDSYTQISVGGAALTSNGIFTYEYDSGSASGVSLIVDVHIADYNTSPIANLVRFTNRGKNYISGETLVLKTTAGQTITVTVGTVTGVVVSPVGADVLPFTVHYEVANTLCTLPVNPTFSFGRKVTIGTNVYLEHEGITSLNNYGANIIKEDSLFPNFPPQSWPWKNADLFYDFPFPDSTGNSYPITGLEAGTYKITVFEDAYSCKTASNGVSTIKRRPGCFAQKTITIAPGVTNITNGCTDNNASTNDGSALNYNSASSIDDGSCIYCRAIDGKLVDNTSTELSVSGSANPGDIFTSNNNSTTLAATTSVSTDGNIVYTRTLNSIMNYYTNQIVNAAGTSNANFKMELHKRSSSSQTLAGASQVGNTVLTNTNVGFNFDFVSSWSQGLTYGYYAIKSYVDDPDSASEQEQCFQVDYFIIPVLACITGQPGLQVGITTDNVTITDLDLVVSSIPGNNLNPCTLQCCDAPTINSYIVQTSPSCGTPSFNIAQSCPNGVDQYITNTLHDIEFSSDNGVTWSSIWANSVSNSLNHGYTINIYNSYGPGDYRVSVTRTFTWANGTTSQCIDSSNSVSLSADICGCTDPTSLNFNPLAVVDDGSCVYCINGCMNQSSINYNSLATCDDGSCMGCVYGCMDAGANNYNSFATCDDGSCNYGVGCGCTNILASNFGYDCAGNAVGFPPTCDDGCCEGLCVNPPDITTPIITTEATCGCPQTAGCNSSLVGTSGGPGYFILDLDFGTDKGVAVITFNTGHSNTVTAPLTNSIPDIMRVQFDGTTTSEYSSLVGGYLTGLVGTPDDGGSTWLCPGCDQSGYLTTSKNISVFEFNQSTQKFQSTFNTQSVGPYGANSTGDVTLSIWPIAGNVIPNIGQTPNYRTTFNQDGHFNRNSVSYISVPTSTTASTAKILIEAPCPSTWWGVTLSCPNILTGMGGSVSAPYGSNNTTVTALSITTEYFHIPVDRAGGTNPNSAYWNGTGAGVGQQSGTLGKHDWIFTDAYGENRLAAGNYKIESPAASGVFWNVTVGVPTYVDDVNDNTAPAGPVEGGVVLMMEGPL